MTNPIFDYGRSDGCRSITGGAFVPNGLWPAAYQGKYLFADFGCGKIFRLDPNGVGGFTRVDFATALGSNSVVALGFGPAGATQALYYTTYAGGGQVRRIVDTRPMASIATNATPAVTLGGTAQDVATVTVAPAGSPVPSGTVTFAVFGPDNATCAGSPVATSTTALSGSVPRTATSNTFIPDGGRHLSMGGHLQRRRHLCARRRAVQRAGRDHCRHLHAAPAATTRSRRPACSTPATAPAASPGRSAQAPPPRSRSPVGAECRRRACRPSS